jgi:hypothetical protein
MNLKSFGCSFIFGSELSDDKDDGQFENGRRLENGSKLTWPAHLAQHLSYDYLCYAWPGAGNLQIAEQVLTQLCANETSLFVINWSYIDRFDFCANTQYRHDHPWATLMPIDTTSTAQVYYKELHSELRDKLTTLMSMKLVIDTLEQKNCPFIMTYMDDLIFDQRWHTTPAIILLQEYIKPYMTTFEGLNFQQWSKKNGYPITVIGHPLEEAHAAAGKLMIKVLDTQNTNDR